MRVDRSIKRNPPRMSYKSRRTPHFYRRIGRNRPIDAFNPHQRSGLNASNRTIMNISWSSDRGWTLQMIRLKCILKRFASRPFDRDRAVEMSSPPFHLSRYNPINSSTCVMIDRWSTRPRVHAIDARISNAAPILRLSLIHMACILKCRVN